jgi:hypothetical protein
MGDVEIPANARKIVEMAGRLIQLLDASFGGANSGAIHAAPSRVGATTMDIRDTEKSVPAQTVRA